MSSDWYRKRVDLTIHRKKQINKKLKEYETTGKDIEYLRLNLTDCTNLLEILRTFLNIKELEVTIYNYTEDLRKAVVLPCLRKVYFEKLIPMDFKNLWGIFSNLEDITIGSRDNYEVFTSEFVNRVIGRNEKSLKILRLLDIPLVATTSRPLRIACQLEELEIIFFNERSKEKICRTQEYRLKSYEKEKYMKVPGKIFYTNEDQLTTFVNLKDVLKDQKQLRCLELDEAEIDGEMMDIIASKKSLEYLKIMSPEFKFNEISTQSQKFLRNLKSLYLSHFCENSSNALGIILENIKNVEVLEIHCIWPEVNFAPPTTRNILPNLRELNMHINHKSEEILDSLTFSDKLEKFSGDIVSVDKVEGLLKSSPNIKHFVLHHGSDEVANFVVTKFKSLEWFEVTLDSLCLDTVILIIENATNIKRARILLYFQHSRQDEEYLEEKLRTYFQGFFFTDTGSTMEIHHKNMDFKMKIGYHHFMQGRDWDI